MMRHDFSNLNNDWEGERIYVSSYIVPISFWSINCYYGSTTVIPITKDSAITLIFLETIKQVVPTPLHHLGGLMPLIIASSSLSEKCPPPG